MSAFPTRLAVAVGVALVGGALAPAPCFRGSDKLAMQTATDAASCTAAGAECVYNAAPNVNAGEVTCGSDICPTEKAAFVTSITAGTASDDMRPTPALRASFNAHFRAHFPSAHSTDHFSAFPPLARRNARIEHN